MACPKAAYLVSIIHPVLASNSGVRLLLSASDTYVPKPGNMKKPCSTGQQGALLGLTWAGMKPDTLEISCTELMRFATVNIFPE